MVALATEVTASSNGVTVTVPDALAPGSYSIRVHISSVVYSEARYTISSKCGVTVDCGSHGQCAEATGVGTCTDGYSGATCSLSPCAAAECSVVGTSSCTVSGTTATCNCNSNYIAGSYRCLSPSFCSSAAACQNGGVRVATEGTTQCGDCRCFGNWRGKACEECGFNCRNGIDNGCATCECSPGYIIGPSGACTCRYTTLNVVFALSTVPYLFTDATRRSAWHTALQNDVRLNLDPTATTAFAATVSSYTKVRSGGVDLVQYALRVRTWCDPTYESGFTVLDNTDQDLLLYGAYQKLETLKAAVVAGTLSSDTPLGMVYQATGVGLTDTACVKSCPVSAGLGGVAVADTVDEGEEEVKDEDSDSGGNTLAIALGVALGGAFLITLIVLIARCRGCCCFASQLRPARREQKVHSNYGSRTNSRERRPQGTQMSSRNSNRPSTVWTPRDYDVPNTPWNV